METIAMPLNGMGMLRKKGKVVKKDGKEVYGKAGGQIL
jgi:hypothetical protein